MASRKSTTRKYTRVQRQEILKRVAAGETQVAIAASSGVPLATVGYWARKAKNTGSANGGTRTTGRRGRPAGSSNRVTGTFKSGGIAWTLDGDVLLVRIPLRTFARHIAARALENI